MQQVTVSEKRRQHVPDLLIRGLDEDVYLRLKSQARRNGVSMQVEATSILAANVKPTIKQWVREVAEYHKTLDPDRPRMTGQEVADLIREGHEERDQWVDDLIDRNEHREP